MPKTRPLLCHCPRMLPDVPHHLCDFCSGLRVAVVVTAAAPIIYELVSRGYEIADDGRTSPDFSTRRIPGYDGCRMIITERPRTTMDVLTAIVVTCQSDKAPYSEIVNWTLHQQAWPRIPDAASEDMVLALMGD